MRAASRSALGVAALVMLALGGLSSHLAAAHPAAALGGGAVWEGLIQTVAAAAAVASGVVLAVDRRLVACGALLAAAGPAILLAQVPVPDAGSPVLFTAALIGGSLASALAASAGLAFRIEQIARIDRAIAVLAIGASAGVAGLLSAMVFDPRASGCYACPTNLVEVANRPVLQSDFSRWALILTALWGVALGARTGWKWWRAPTVVRRSSGPFVLAGGVIAALAVITAVHTLLLPTPVVNSTTRASSLIQCGLVAVMAVAVAAETVRGRRRAGQVAQAVLRAVPDPDMLTSTLAASINDPRLTLVYRTDHGDIVDAAGHAANTTDDAVAVLTVIRADTVVAEVRYNPRLLGTEHRLRSAVRAAGLAIEHVGAHARLRSELAELAASRRRVIAAGDAERRRLERDLHDGAQQRLIMLQLALHKASAQGPAISRERYASARRELGIAIEELRDLAHGIHPTALTDGGLVVGLRMLAETSPVALVVVTDQLPRRCGAAAESAVYRLVADVIGRLNEASSSRAGPAMVVTVLDSDEWVRVSIRSGLDVAGCRSVLAGTTDRMTALGGEITLNHAADGTTIQVSVPCGS